MADKPSSPTPEELEKMERDIMARQIVSGGDVHITAGLTIDQIVVMQKMVMEESVVNRARQIIKTERDELTPTCPHCTTPRPHESVCPACIAKLTKESNDWLNRQPKKE